MDRQENNLKAQCLDQAFYILKKPKPQQISRQKHATIFAD
jgi:hypothetical protein